MHGLGLRWVPPEGHLAAAGLWGGLAGMAIRSDE